jgi:hypothetical protein
MFSETLAKVKKLRDEQVQVAMAEGVDGAEKAFPDLVKEIEKSAATGHCVWIEQRGKRTTHDNFVQYYCMGFKERVIQLANNSDFSFEIQIAEKWWALNIKW